MVLSAAMIGPIATSNRIITGTTVVAIRTNTEIILAADSRIVAVGDTPQNVGTTCKIVRVGDIYFASAGLLRDTRNTFNVRDAVVEASGGGGGPSDVVLRFEQVIRGPLIRTIQQIKDEHPAYFRSELDNKNALEIAFGAFEHGTPKLFVRSFLVSQNGHSVDVARVDCPGVCSGDIGSVFLGRHSIIDKFMDANPHFFRIGWEQSIERLIGLEASARPNDVSLPANVLRIHANGSQWLTRNEVCPGKEGPW
jgi:hypothetical protein